MCIGSVNTIVGWAGILGGVVAGAVIGIFFHDDNWLGGYGSYRRRLLRLGHISLVGLGIINLLFALSLTALRLPALHTQVAAWGFVAGAVTMPLCCCLTAWRKPLRHLFPIPVISVLAGLVSVLLGWWSGR